MANIYMDVNTTSINQNQFYKTRAAIWVDDNKEVRAVLYSIGPTATAEVWENLTCISVDLTFAMAYLRGAGFKDLPSFESFEDYSVIASEVDDEFSTTMRQAKSDQLAEKEMPF